MRRRRGVAAVLAGALAVGGLVGCSAAGRASADIEVVASTDVYATIAEQLVAGVAPERVGVTAIIGDPSLDPHEYEASARNELSVSRADLIIENGGGYDDFMDTLRSAAGAGAPVINAVELSGHANDANLNEHVWFDLHTVERVARRITAYLLEHDRPDARILRRNAQMFAGQLRALEATEAQIRSQYAGTGVAITESVPLYLLTACGLVNRTPPAFSNAIEEGTDASPRLLQATLDLFATHQVRLLVENEQTAGPQTDQLVSAATEARVPVLGVVEILPAGVAYVAWLQRFLHAIAAALS